MSRISAGSISLDSTFKSIRAKNNRPIPKILYFHWIFLFYHFIILCASMTVF
jgi:hypothetical protein